MSIDSTVKMHVVINLASSDQSH